MSADAADGPSGDIPAVLRRHAREVCGPAGDAWIAALPATIAACARAWDLAVAPPFPDLSFNYVAPATRADGTPAVLKVCLPTDERATEIAALRHYDGQGAIRLLAADLDRGALLLERATPGAPLAALADDEEATRIAAGVMRRLWRPAPADHAFPTIGDWLTAVRRAPAFLPAHPTFPARWLDEALARHAALDAASAAPVVLHGDLHHTNILAAGDGRWLAIDPKGVIGERACEAGPLFYNPIGVARRPDLAALLARRLDVLAAALDIGRARLRDWGVVMAVLSAAWSLEDEGDGWRDAMTVAVTLAGLEV